MVLFRDEWMFGRSEIWTRFISEKKLFWNIPSRNQNTPTVIQQRQRGEEARNTNYRKVNTVKDKII